MSAEADDKRVSRHMTKQRIETLKAMYFKVAATPPGFIK